MSVGMISAGIALILHPGHKVLRYAYVPAPLPKQTFDVAPSKLPKVDVPAPEVGQPATPTKSASESHDVPSCSLDLRPSRIIDPNLCLDGPLVSITRDPRGALNIPHDVRTVGMWDEGASLTDNVGTTLLAGHVDYVGQGNGTFYNLYRSRPGDIIYATDSVGHVTVWRVVSLDVVVKSKLPISVFAGKTGPRLLVMVTCGGPVEYVPNYGMSYRDNVIVTAVPIEQVRKLAGSS